MHAVAEEQLLQPAGQERHCSLATSAQVPLGHCNVGTHALVCPTLAVPAGHEAAHAELPAELYVPATHGTARTRPVVSQKLPAEHVVVLVRFVVGQKERTEHGVHALSPVVEPKVPAAHTADGAVRPALLQNDPSVQAVCVDMPTSGQNLPAWHDLQLRDPVVFTYVPAGHEVQTAAAAPENVPVGHCLHVSPSAPYEPGAQSVQSSV